MTAEGSLAADLDAGAVAAPPAPTESASPGATQHAFGILDAIDPATRELFAHVFVTLPPDIPALVARAQVAARTWGDLSGTQRADALRRLRDLVALRAHEIAETIARGMGKPLIEALSFEVATVLETLDDCLAQCAGNPAGAPEAVQGDSDAKSAALCEPGAVVCVLAPVSLPFERAMTPAVRALAAGSAVLIKPTASAPLVGVLIAQLLQRALSEFPSLAQVVLGDADTGTRLATAAGIDLVVFSGSRDAARKVLAALEPLSRPARVQVGCAVPLIVCDDANLERAANATVFGRFSNNGQSSATVGWVYVQRAVADAFVHKVVHKVRALKSGPYTDPHCELGPLASGRGLEHLRAVLQDALDQRALLVTGGFPAHVTGHNYGERLVARRQGFFWPPTVVNEASRSTRLMREETFGPILPICVVEDDQEAISLANGAPSGFGACVFSADVARARRIAAELKAGCVTVNDLLLTDPKPKRQWSSGLPTARGEQVSIDAGSHNAPRRVVIDDGRSDRDVAWFPYSAAKLQALGRELARAPTPRDSPPGSGTIDG